MGGRSGSPRTDAGRIGKALIRRAGRFDHVVEQRVGFGGVQAGDFCVVSERQNLPSTGGFKPRRILPTSAKIELVSDRPACSRDRERRSAFPMVNRLSPSACWHRTLSGVRWMPPLPGLSRTSRWWPQVKFCRRREKERTLPLWPRRGSFLAASQYGWTGRATPLALGLLRGCHNLLQLPRHSVTVTPQFSRSCDGITLRR